MSAKRLLPGFRGIPLVLFCAFTGLFLLSACGRSSQKAARDAAPVPVQLGKVIKQALPLKVKAIGTVQCQRQVTVKSQVDGVVQQVHFLEGQDVMAGDLLVSIDKRPFQNALAIAKADLANAIAEASRAAGEAERYRKLDQQEAVSKEQYSLLVTKAETSKAQVQAKEAAVANAQLQLSYTEIRAPIGGRTGQRNLHEGALVKANDNASALVTINQLNPIMVAYSVPEKSLDAIRAAMTAGKVLVRCTTRDDTPRSVEGVLQFVDNAVDAATGMVLLKATFENTSLALWPGRFVDVETSLGAEPDRLLVPASAVQIGQRGAQVFVVKADKHVELRLVKMGRALDGQVSLLEGVSEGETVVTDGQVRLVPDALIVERALGAEEPAKTRKKP